MKLSCVWAFGSILIYSGMGAVSAPALNPTPTLHHAKAAEPHLTQPHRAASHHATAHAAKSSAFHSRVTHSASTAQAPPTRHKARLTARGTAGAGARGVARAS